ncbi:hypothetical protein TorRG33x02_303290 [Trema orientale]|uniref:Uncharacterized protein n=1 Tax=Trema orientale TaxID=63057 RepID=A0A2P5BZL3_TREOI|nr:hypothetical protein TorRG33x02_303290 [Trema orientale]
MSDPFTSGSNKTNAASAANGLALTVLPPMPQPLILLKPLPFAISFSHTWRFRQASLRRPPLSNFQHCLIRRNPRTTPPTEFQYIKNLSEPGFEPETSSV